MIPKFRIKIDNQMDEKNWLLPSSFWCCLNLVILLHTEIRVWKLLQNSVCSSKKGDVLLWYRINLLNHERDTPAEAKIICDKNVKACVSIVSYLKNPRNIFLEEKKLWESFGICLVNTTAHFHLSWTWFPMLFSRQIWNGSHNFFFLFLEQFF